MKIRILSDLHLEHMWYRIPPGRDDRDTILILAGDIAPLMWSNTVTTDRYDAGHMFKQEVEHRTLLSFLVQCSRQFKHVIYVAGNHEFYGCFFDHKLESIKVAIDSMVVNGDIDNNIHALADDAVVIDGVKFVGSTLWTDMKVNQYGLEMMKHSAKFAMADYHYIYDDQGRPIAPDATIIAHDRSVQFIDNALNCDMPCVLITHHGISERSIADHYQGNSINGAFVSDLDYLLLEREPVLAVHGHVHWGFDYYIGSTRVIVNPRGYPKEGNPFDPMLEVDLDIDSRTVTRYEAQSNVETD